MQSGVRTCPQFSLQLYFEVDESQIHVTERRSEIPNVLVGGEDFQSRYSNQHIGLKIILFDYESNEQFPK